MKKKPDLMFTIQIFKEGKKLVAYNPELDVSSCGNTTEEARQNLKDALTGFMKSAKEMGTLDEILEQAGFVHVGKSWNTPELITLDRFSLAA